MILQLKLFRLNYRFESDKQMAQTMIIEFVFYKIHKIGTTNNRRLLIDKSHLLFCHTTKGTLGLYLLIYHIRMPTKR